MFSPLSLASLRSMSCSAVNTGGILASRSTSACVARKMSEVLSVLVRVSGFWKTAGELSRLEPAGRSFNLSSLSLTWSELGALQLLSSCRDLNLAAIFWSSVDREVGGFGCDRIRGNGCFSILFCKALGGSNTCWDWGFFALEKHLLQTLCCLSLTVMVCLRQPEHTENPHPGQPCSRVNREKDLVQLEQDILWKY